ncbi:hypothetical protein OWM54_35445 [Myxococcus sp. MISCRS1]|uniref:hypothetical protein n=1 Tax=unclassified Myxococcus TaxID=2648731 RepID=UPI001CBAAE28|nr:hypothetical protein [Myxococcus sp. MISCRS1]MBZ4401932.1 hypothetical protein [Myxococcus sp. AS-1-15]MBZ4407260.1 hypothetical protein [Myxococcus sp. XM-1-1-1]MCY1002463.1 hypothetical protein [Myxococcus sp. MISCRS1]
MSAYPVVLFLHSWVRWAVVLLGVLALGRALRGWSGGREWTRGDRRLQVFCVSAFDTQMLLGMVLYSGLSPFTPFSLQGGLRESLAHPTLRFFGIEHPTLMLLALVVAHVGSALSQRADVSVTRHRAWALGLLVAMGLVACAIPWAGLSQGRPLFRGF